MSGILGGIAGNLAGGNIGRAVVSLVLDTTGYNSQLAKAEGETAASTNTMSSGFDKFKGAAIAGAAVAGVALVDFAKTSVDAAVEAASEQLKLANAVQNSGLSAQQAIPAFQAQAAALRDLTGVDDDVINGAQSILVNMGLQQSQITQLTPLVVDLSQKYGVNLDTAMKAVGKAVEGSTGGLARMVGPIQTGSTAAETYTNVLTKLGSVQGFAAQQAQAEPWRLLAAQFGELQEKIGAQLLPVIQEMVPVLTDLATNVAPLLVSGLSALVPILENVATAAKGASDALALLSGNLPDDFWAGAADRLDIATKLFGGLTNQTDQASQAMIDARIAQLQAGDAAQTTGQQVDFLTGMTRDATQAAERHVQALQDERLALLQSAGGVLGLVSNLQQLKQDQAEVNKLERQGKTDTAAYSSAVLTAVTDQASFRASIIQTAQDLRDAGETTGQVKTAILNMARQAGISGAQLRTALGGPLQSILGDIRNINQTTIAPRVDTSALTVGERAATRFQDTLNRLA